MLYLDIILTNKIRSTFSGASEYVGMYKITIICKIDSRMR